MIGFLEYNNVGAIGSEAVINVDSAGIAYTVTAGKKGVSFQNVGSKIAWYGGSNVHVVNKIGNKLFQNQGLVYKGVKNTFKIYFKTATGDTTTIGVINHD